MRCRWWSTGFFLLMLSALASGGCGLLAGLGDEPQRAAPPDTTPGDSTSDGAGPDADAVDGLPPLAPNLLAYDGVAGRAQLVTLAATGALEAASPFALEVELVDLVELTPKSVVGYSAKTGKLSAFGLGSVGLAGRDDADYPGYEHLAALNAKTVMLYRSTPTLAHYLVLERLAAGWKPLLEQDITTPEFLGLDRFARTRTDKLMFRTTTGGTGYLATWTGSTLDGRWIRGGSAGWTEIVPLSGPSLFYFSLQSGAVIEGAGALERIYPDNTSSVVVYWGREDFPWKTQKWTSVVGTSNLLLFYRRSDGAAKAVALEVDPALVLRPAPVTVTPSPAPGFTRWLSLE